MSRTALTTAPVSGNPWIVSRLWDALLFIGAPVTCAALLLPLARLFPSKSYAFFLLAFFTFGHHLPGFLRAYLDKELFRRYRWRFLLAPILMFSAALWFDQQGLHGLLLFVFAWDIWHVLMQHFGFMRIYDAKTGETDSWTSRMDWAVSISVYLSMIAASPHYRHNLVLQSFQSGFPLRLGEAYSLLQTALFGCTAALVVAYAVFCVIRWRQGRLNTRKVALLTVFIGASWYLYVVHDDFIVGFAVWSAFHCLQYYAIVWVYSANRVAKGALMSAVATWLFQPTPGRIAAYGALILLYGGINYARILVSGVDWIRYLSAYIATSNMLHYYYDGFIWKVRDPKTRQSLGIAATGNAGGPSAWTTSGWVHAGAFCLLVGLLGWLEGARPYDELAMRRALTVVAPQAAEAHLHVAESLLAHGNYREAIPAYRESLRLKPASLEAQLNLGVTLANVGRIDEAIEAYQRVLAMDPGVAVARFNLAGLLVMRGRTAEARPHYEAALVAGDAQTRELARQAIAQIGTGR